NVYVAGAFTDTVDFDPGPGQVLLTNFGGGMNTDTFVASYTPAGTLRWVKQIGGWRGDEPTALALDNAGNVIVTGTFIGPIDLDPGLNQVSFNSGLQTATYVCKLDTAGNYVWGKMLTGSSLVQFNGVAVDSADNVILAGLVQGTADFGGVIPTLTTIGGYDVLVAKLSPSGTWQWANLVGSVNHDEATAVAVDLADTILVTGYYQGVADFDPDPSNAVTLNQGDVGSTFVAKYDPSGALVWAHGLGSTAYAICPGTAITTDAAGNVYTTGELKASGYFGPGPGAVTLASGGLTDTFVTKMDPSGNVLWAKGFGGSGYDYANGIRVDAAGSVYLAGEFGDYSPTSDFDPSPGVFNLTSAGGSDAYVMKLDASGGFVWARQMGGTGIDAANAVALDAKGTVYVVGSFRTTTAFAPGLPGGTRTSNGGSDLFVARFDQGEVAGVVWADANGNGLRDDGEPLLAGVAVELFDSVDNRSVGTVITDANGAYRFTSPANRNCYVVVRPPAGQALVAADQGNDARDSDFDPITGRTPLFLPDLRQRTFDAGLRPTDPVLRFAHGIGGPGYEAGRVITTDDAGNVYVAGDFTGTVDFDPSSAEVPLTSIGSNGDLFVACYDPTGVLLWVRQIGGGAILAVTGIAVDAGNNVYLSGELSGTADFDPGAGTFNLTSVNNSDVFVTKLDATGGFQWALKLGNATVNDTSGGLAVDATGNVYVAGTFRGTADFNPGPATFNLTSAGVDDAFVTKLNAGGGFVWARRFGGIDSEAVTDIAVDGQGQVYTTGRFNGTVDFDPGPGIVPLVSNQSHDVFVSKLDAAGGFVWARRIGGASTDFPGEIAVDTAGNVTVAGEFQDSADFDPGVGDYLLTSAGNTDVFLVRLDAAGGFVWARRFGGPGMDDVGDLAVDGRGNVYTTGDFGGTVDFDPGAGEYSLTGTSRAVFVSKLDPAGQFNAAYAFPCPTDFGCDGYGIATDGNGGVYATGGYTGSLDVSLGGPAQTLTGTNLDIFLIRLQSAAAVRGTAWVDANGNGFRDPGELPLAGVTVELFDTGDGIAGNGDDRSLGVAYTAADGTYRFADPPLNANSYYLVARLPGGYGLSAVNSGDDASDNDFDPLTGRTSRFARVEATQTFDVGARVSATASASGFLASAGGTAAEDVRSVARDPAGNVYVAGTFRGTIDLDPGPAQYWLTSAGGADIYVASSTPAGALRWAYRLGGSDDDAVGGLAVDATGAQYLSGSFRGTADFDPGPFTTPVTSAAGADVFVARIDASRSLSWVRRIGGGGHETATGLALDATGAVLVTGDFPGTVNFDPAGGAARTSLGARDAFVWKLDRNGQFVWVRQLGGLDTDDTAAAVTTDSTNAVYVTGAFRGTVDFDPSNAIRDLTSAGHRDVYLWKLDASGNLLWARQAGGAQDDLGLAVAIDPTGTVSVAGSFRDTASFDPTGTGLPLTAAGDTDAFVWTVSAAGAVQWARGFGGIGTDVARAVAADVSGVYLAGEFQDSVDFDPGPGVLALTSNGGLDGFLVKLDPAGDRHGARQVGGTGDDRALALGLDAAGRVVLAGTFTAPPPSIQVTAR
ncbi:MAG: SBBP repeat-containing protein, partial [Gemmataceae bacterium]